MIRRYGTRSRIGTPQPDRDFSSALAPQTVLNQTVPYNLGTTGTQAGLNSTPLAVPTGLGGAFNVPGSPLQGRRRDNIVGHHGKGRQHRGHGYGLPMSPEFEAAHRALDDALAQQLMAIGVQRDQIPAMLAQMNARMNTDQGFDLKATDEADNARGLYNSGIRQQDRGEVNLGYDRQRQDVAQSTGQQYSQLASQESQAQSDYQKQLSDLMIQLAKQQASNPNLATPNRGRRGKHRARKKDRRR